MNKGKLLLGLLASVAAGAAIGILIAPAKGSDTRKKILKSTNELSHEAKMKLDNLLNEIESIMENSKGKVAEIIDSSKDKFGNAADNGKSTYKDLLTELKSVLHN